ncbi:hypothetical protein CS013_003271, partial [Escherichia coli]|nr:hypothetical protein [Escherichia coli]
AITSGAAWFGVFPAPAGINRVTTRATGNAARVPRASGDKPGMKLNFQATDKCSPRQRG